MFPEELLLSEIRAIVLALEFLSTLETGGRGGNSTGGYFLCVFYGAPGFLRSRATDFLYESDRPAIPNMVKMARRDQPAYRNPLNSVADEISHGRLAVE